MEGDQSGTDVAEDTGGEVVAPARTTPAANVPSAAGQPGAQGSEWATGDLARAGAPRWPTVVGGAAVLAGVVLLRRVGRGEA